MEQKGEHFYEFLLIDTIDDIQCKVYSNIHPKGKIIVKPKWVPNSLPMRVIVIIVNIFN